MSYQKLVDEIKSTLNTFFSENTFCEKRVIILRKYRLALFDNQGLEERVYGVLYAQYGHFSLKNSLIFSNFDQI